MKRLRNKLEDDLNLKMCVQVGGTPAVMKYLLQHGFIDGSSFSVHIGLLTLLRPPSHAHRRHTAFGT